MKYFYLSVLTIIFLCLLAAIFIFINKKLPSPKNSILKHEKSTKIIFLPSPTLDTIFSHNHTWTATLSAKHIRIITATGDVIPARSVNYNVVRFNNPIWPYEKVKPVLQKKKTDITFVNLETPLIKNCLATVEGMIFCGTDRNIEGLKSIGVTTVSLANNHAGNHGEDGVKETVKLLKDNNIMVTGVNGPLYKNIRGITFAFLGFNDITKPQPGIENATDSTIKKQIAQAKKQADIIVVTFHWGVEYRDQPDDDQKRLGHLAIDSGADLVIGNHPHWIQPIEFYKNKLITYAHGNFIFDQMWSQKTREGVIGRYIFYDTTLIDVEYLPLQINNYGQAQFLEGKSADIILDNMKQQSVLLQEDKK
jgi:poly-gamma-glutamate synthesis protein (capsule biosynthesis protein)